MMVIEEAILSEQSLSDLSNDFKNAKYFWTNNVPNWYNFEWTFDWLERMSSEVKRSKSEYNSTSFIDEVEW